MNMKKKGDKALLSLLLGFTAQWLINNFIFKKAVNVNRPGIDEPSLFYAWRYGKVHYTVRGTGAPLLLIHGVSAGAGGHEWYKNVNALAKNYTVYTIDLLGFGYSDKPKTTYTAYLYTKLINDFITDVIKKPVYVAAFNNAAAFCVMAYSFQPTLFKKMLLIKPTGINDEMPTAKSHYLKMLFESPGIGTSIYNYITSRVHIKKFLTEFAFYDKNAVTDYQISNYHYFAHVGGKPSRYALASFMSKYMNVDIKKPLKSIQVPTYIIQKDSMPEFENTYVKSITFENTKAFPHSDNPRTFYSLCRKIFIP